MKIVFFGTPEPAAKILEALISSKHEIICVVTQPDRPKGRGQKITLPPVKEIALRHNLRIEQPERVKNNPTLKALLETIKPDIAVVVAYGKIFPKDILTIPQYGFINVHASLLPSYRGAAPIQWALLNGEKETGVTIMQVDELLDAGPIILQEKVRIEENDNAETLLKKVFSVGQTLLLEGLEAIEKGTAKYFPQKDAAATFAPAITKESGEIDWKKTDTEIHNRIRALVVWPGAHTICHGKILKILRSEIGTTQGEGRIELPGTIVQVVKNIGLVVATGEGNLLIKEVQPEGKKPMSAYDFVIGHDVKTAETLPN